MDIGVLLKEHWQELLDVRSEFLGYALTTKRADRERLERAIAALYSFAGFDPPKRVLWFASSLDALTIATLWSQMLVPVTVSDSKGRDRNVQRLLLTETMHSHFSRADHYAADWHRDLLAALRCPMIITPTSIVPMSIDRVADTSFRQAGAEQRHSMFSPELAWVGRQAIGLAVADTMRQRINDNWADALLKPWSAIRDFLPNHQEGWPLDEYLTSLDAEKRELVFNGLVQRVLLMSAPFHSLFSPLHYAFTVASMRALSVFGIDVANKMPMPHLLEVVKSGGWWWPFENICFACDNPLGVHFDARMRFHSEDGMAIRFEDNWGFHALNGVRVPEAVIQNRFSAVDIDAEPNLAVRARMIERLGLARYVTESGAQEIDRSDYGILYRKEQPPSATPRALQHLIMVLEPVVMVKVINKTPEPDGSFKSYFLRVPPNITTAKEAVAWTFGIEPDEYELTEES